MANPQEYLKATMSTESLQDNIIHCKNRHNVSALDKSSRNLFNDDSGYSSDSSTSSCSLNQKHTLDTSSKRLSHFVTPDVNWKNKLRPTHSSKSPKKELLKFHDTPNLKDTESRSSTPFSFNRTKNVDTPDLDPIEGPLLRSHTYPGACSQTVKKVDCSLHTPNLKHVLTTQSTPTSPTEKIKSEKKSLISLRSPLKSPFKLNKKQKSSEDVSVENSFTDPEARQRAVKVLFSSKTDASPVVPIRRCSPRFSSIFTRIIEYADYLLPNVLRFLSDKDVWVMSQVCQKLRFMVHGSTSLNTRKNRFLERCKNEIEKLGKENVKAKEESTTSLLSFSLPSPRKHLQQLQNSLSSPQKAASSIPLSRFDKFVKEGKKLGPGETQQKCVQCQNPAHISRSENKASCTDKGCGFVYCTRCFLPFHQKPSDCLALKPKPKVSSATKILSKACKKRLRRL